MRSLIVAAILTCCFWAGSGRTATGAQTEFTLDRFCCGFYTYTLDEETAKIVSDAGLNAVYVCGGSRQEKAASWQHTEEEFTAILGTVSCCPSRMALVDALPRCILPGSARCACGDSP